MVLFDALTEFLKKQALKGANEIIGYYSKKYKTVHHYGTGQKGAHVVSHYADVARLVGLTENELYTQLKELKRHANLSKYADITATWHQRAISDFDFRSRRTEFAICPIISSWIAQINRTG